MKKLLAMTLIIGLIASCKKEDPTPQQNNPPPQTQQNCFSDPKLVGKWTCDSVHENLYINSVLIGDTSYQATYNWEFKCITYQSPASTEPSLITTNETSVLYFKGNLVYLDDNIPVDTTEAERFYIDNLTSTKATLRFTTTGTNSVTNKYLYMRK